MRPGAGLAAACLAVLVGASPWAWASAQQACDGSQSSLPAARFKDNGDGTVTDAESKLMWMRCSGGQQWRRNGCAGPAQAYDWNGAVQQAEEVNRTGAAFFNDWRLPNLRELATITDRGCRNPRTHLGVFPDTPAAAFWSSTARPGEAGGERFLALSFGDEGVMLARKEERLHVRLVRTGP